MRRYDLLDEYTTAIAPALGPQALIVARPGMQPRRGHRLATASRGPRAPVLLVALVCILLAFV